MGISLDTWRARIGLFCSAVLCGGVRETATSRGERMLKVSKAYLAYGFVLLTFLVIGEVIKISRTSSELSKD